MVLVDKNPFPCPAYLADMVRMTRIVDVWLRIRVCEIGSGCIADMILRDYIRGRLIVRDLTLNDWDIFRLEMA